MIKILETKHAMKTESKRSEGKNLVFVGNGLSLFITNKMKKFIALFRIHYVTKYISGILESYVNAPTLVSNTAERGIALIKTFDESVREERKNKSC